MTNLIGLPGDSQVWVVDGHWYAVWTAPGTDVPMMWHIPNVEDLNSMFTGTPTFDEQLTQEQVEERGGIYFGTTSEIQNTTEHPFETVVATFQQEAEIRPWLRDPEVFSVHMAAVIEGRAVTDAELQTTEWFSSRTDAQREWVALLASDRQTALQRRDDVRVLTRQQFEQAGFGDVSDERVNRLADRLTRGDISQTEWADLVEDEAAPRSAESRERVRGLVAEWLGPVVGRGWNEADIRRWAGRLSTETGAEDQLVETLRRQRLAAMPEWDDPQLRYADIAPTARQAFLSVWGRQADEADPLFLKVARTGDISAMEGILKKEGLRRDVDLVKRTALADLDSAFGDDLAEAI